MAQEKIVCMRCEDELEAGRYRCRCGALGEVRHDLESMNGEGLLAGFQGRRGARSGVEASGVWRFRELIMPRVKMHQIVTRREGNTRIYRPPALVKYLGLGKLSIKHEGENPTGSFKDRGMTVGVTRAVHEGARAIACASTGNTSASLAAYGAAAGLPAVVFVPAGKIARAKLAQTVAYGAKVVEIDGNFDDAMNMVVKVCRELDMALLNSVNPWRIEGQKSIIFELLDDLDWQVPDWIVFPAGNLGNTSAFGKALRELYELGLLERMPKLVAVQAEGASPFFKFYQERLENPRAELVAEANPETVATAIRIGNPQSWEKAIREINATKGMVLSVTDQEIMEAKLQIDGAGIGCEPASAASIAGIHQLIKRGIIGSKDHAVAILTGHFLKDVESALNWHEQNGASHNRIRVSADFDAIAKALDKGLA
ncbi:MAG: threonine synthase [Planctomycetota bacterium]|nr:threonine synthase [Planctomycetota bacterium]